MKAGDKGVERGPQTVQWNFMSRKRVGDYKRFRTPKDLAKAAQSYFEWVAENPLYDPKPFHHQGEVQIVDVPRPRAMTLQALCLHIGIRFRTWTEYRKYEGYEGVVEDIENIIRSQKFEGAAADIFNPAIIARELGLADKQEHSGPDGGPIKTTTEVFEVVGVKPDENTDTRQTHADSKAEEV